MLYGMEDHDQEKVALQDDQLQQLLVKHQNERRTLMHLQHQQLHTHRLALLNNHWTKQNKRPNEFSKDKQEQYQAQLMLLEQQNKQRLLMARQEQDPE